LRVKGNQSRLERTLASFFASTTARAQAATDAAEQTLKEHGRLDHYRLRRTTALNDYLDQEYHWPALGQVICIEHTRVRLKTGEVSRTTHYAITSLPVASAPAAMLLQLWRKHWHIENKAHWVRDVVFGEDASRVRTGSLPEVLALLRTTVITRLRLAGMDGITEARSRLSTNRSAAEFLVGIPLE
jgi:hypothetical protein